MAASANKLPQEDRLAKDSKFYHITQFCEAEKSGRGPQLGNSQCDDSVHFASDIS